MSEKKYIDADKLSKLISETRLNLPHDSKDFFTRDCMLLNFQQTIDLEPAADVAEVVHGEWIDELVECNGVAEIKSVCSLCGNPNKQYKPPYCPHCGAKMDKEQEENA